MTSGGRRGNPGRFDVHSYGEFVPELERSAEGGEEGIVTLIVLSRKGPHGFPFRRPHSRFPIH